MGKRAALAFFISLLIIMGYNYYMAQKYPPPTRPAYQQADRPAREVVSEQEKGVLPYPAALEMQPEKKNFLLTRELSQAKDIVVETDLVRIVITSSGARIKSCQLKEYPEEKLRPQAIQKQISTIDQALVRAASEAKESLQREKDKLRLLLEKVEQEPEMAELVSLTASIDADFSPTILFADDKDVNLALNTALYKSSQSTLTLSEGRSEGQLEFFYTDAQGRTVKKTYFFSNSNYGIGLEISFLGWEKGVLPGEHFLLFYGPDVGLPQAQGGRRMPGYKGPVTYFLNAQQGWTLKEKYGRKESGVFIRREHTGRIGWTALENKYFLTALIPGQPVESVIIEKNRFGEQKVALKVPWKGVGPYYFRLYLGPKKETRLKEIGVTLEKSMDYGFFGPIARFIYQVLVFFSRWTNNFGWAIVLLCLLTKIIFYPLTHHTFESMQKMQQQMKTIQPEMEALREKLKDSPQKLNKEIMALYRKKGVNPLSSCQSGCLPLLLQMPVFFALYAVLYNSIELRGTPFLGWIEDLSTKDPYYILPVLMGISMFIQQKLTGMGTTGGAQQEQAKMMAVLMPIFLTWIFASLPSGVVLYWLTFNIATALQQLLIKRKQAVAAT